MNQHHQALLDYGAIKVWEIPHRMATLVELRDGSEFHARRPTLEERTKVLMTKIKKHYDTERNKLARMIGMALLILCSIAGTVQAQDVVQPGVSVGAPLGARTFVASIMLPADVVQVDGLISLTHAANWFDAPGKWEWERAYDSAGYVKSVNVYVTLDATNTTVANGQTICCWTAAGATLIATDVRGMRYSYPFQVLAQ